MYPYGIGNLREQNSNQNRNCQDYNESQDNLQNRRPGRTSPGCFQLRLKPLVHYPLKFAIGSIIFFLSLS